MDGQRTGDVFEAVSDNEPSVPPWRAESAFVLRALCFFLPGLASGARGEGVEDAPS